MEQNLDFLKAGNFRFVINDPEFDEVNFFVTKASLPGFSISPPNVDIRGSSLYVAGDSEEYSEESFDFFVLEDLSNYLFVLKKIRESLDHTNNDDHYVTCSLLVTNSENVIVAEFVYYNCLLKSISGLDFQVNDQKTDEVKATISFVYSHFEVRTP